jgi:hypothetical protein
MMEPRNVVEHGVRRAIVSAAVIAATLLEIIDTTIVNVALPNIKGAIGGAFLRGHVALDRNHYDPPLAAGITA